METTLLPEEFTKYRERHERIYVIVSPPRCSSTAFARVFWEQPSVRYYYHEPFETTYYQGEGLPEVIAKLDAPLDLTTIKHFAADTSAHALVIKEMPYQVGDNFPLLAALATKPLIFLMRDPRLQIASRREKKLEVGDSPLYPFVESGWDLLEKQIDFCRRARHRPPAGRLDRLPRPTRASSSRRSWSGSACPGPTSASNGRPARTWSWTISRALTGTSTARSWRRPGSSPTPPRCRRSTPSPRRTACASTSPTVWRSTASCSRRPNGPAGHRAGAQLHRLGTAHHGECRLAAGYAVPGRLAGSTSRPWLITQRGGSCFHSAS